MADKLISKSIWIFSIVITSFGLLAFFPSPFTISLATLSLGVLILYQAYIILKDKK